MMDKLYYLPVDEFINQDVFNQLLLFVPNEKKEQVKRFHFDIDRKLSLYAELLVRINACKMLGIKNEEIVFKKSEFGKPYIKHYPDFYYNISHTRNALVIVVSDNPIGIDIEKVRKAELQIADRFFTLAEREYINEETSQTDKRFYEVWTKKEAYIKFIGKGLSMPLNSFNTFNETISKRIKIFEKHGYIISVCGKCLDKEFEIVELTETQAEILFLQFCLL